MKQYIVLTLSQVYDKTWWFLNIFFCVHQLKHSLLQFSLLPNTGLVTTLDSNYSKTTVWVCNIKTCQDTVHEQTPENVQLQRSTSSFKIDFESWTSLSAQASLFTITWYEPSTNQSPKIVHYMDHLLIFVNKRKT
jgi:hypothetical protein